jgi:hypothetical protein
MMAAGRLAEQPPTPPKNSPFLLYENQNPCYMSLHWKIEPSPSEPESHPFAAFLMEPNWGQEFFYLNRP